MSKLLPKHGRFVTEYLIDLNAAQAAIRAGYSKRYAKELGYRLVRKPAVKAEIERRSAALAKKYDVTLERVVAELEAIGFADIRALYDERGNLKAIDQLDQRTAAAIAGVDVEEAVAVGRGKKRVVTRTHKIKRFDKVRALEVLGKHFGLRSSDQAPPPAAAGPGLTVIVQQGVAVEGQRVVQQGTRVSVNLPPPE